MTALILTLLALLLAALSAGVAFSHVLEIPGKRRIPTDCAITLQQLLYTGYRAPAAVIDIGSIVAALVATLLVWGRGAALGLTLAAAVALLATMAVFVLVTDRQNRRILGGLTTPLRTGCGYGPLGSFRPAFGLACSSWAPASWPSHFESVESDGKRSWNRSGSSSWSPRVSCWSGWSLAKSRLLPGRLPALAKAWTVFTYGLLFLGELNAWWRPYFFGTNPQRKARYRAMFGRTHALLPERNGIVPNTFHVVLHVATAVCLVAAIWLAATP